MLPISVLSVLIVIFGNISGNEDFSFNKERYSKLRRLVASDVAIENGISIITTEPPIKQFFKWDVTATNFNNNSLELTTVNSDIQDNIIVNERKPTKIRKRKRKGRRRRRKFRKTTTIAPNFQSDQTELNANSTATVRVKNRRRNRKQRKNRKNRRKNRLQNPSILEITTARNKNLPVVSTSIKDLIQKLNDNPEESFEEKHFNSTVLKVPDIVSLNTTKTINLHVNMGTNSTRKLHTRNRYNRCSKNNGNCAHICHPKGPQKCSCSYGFVLSSDKRNCLDVDECSMNNGGCEMNCKNTLGSYNCYCSSGYRLTDDLLSCEDVNECLLRNGHGPCHGNCENTFGSYKCNCKNLNGTKLGNDGHSCVDIDECSEGKSGCSHNCINALGRSYCTCPEGLELSSDWKTCQDLNECDDEFIRDSCNGECINTDGSYTCLSHGEYQNDQALNDLYQVTCKPLFPPKHGFYTCSRKGALQTYTKSGRKRIKNSPGTTCKLECPVGYKLFGQLHVTCDFFGIWRGKLTGKCLPAREPVIKCPANQTLLLPKGSKKVLVKFPSPQTNIHWKYVKSNPVWAKNLNGELNEGIHSIVFLVKDPTSKLITTCSFTITVYDDEK